MALASLALGGCGSLGYLAHVSLGQIRVLMAREPLDEERVRLLSEDERAGLERLREARRFGASLGLVRSTAYRHLVDGEAGRGVQVVVASPPDRLQGLTWWFPIVGRISYRGYFDAARATAFAEELGEQGYDTYVRPAPLYSTLGWFDDPIPRAMLAWPEIDVVDTALHELVHETVFVADDADYNEALATFVANEATLRFFVDDPELRDRARRSFADRRRYADLLGELARELEALYLEVDGAEDARRRREPVFRRYQVEVFPAGGWETARYSAFPELVLSNAFVVAQRTYLGELGCFAAWLETLGGDLSRFIAEHREQPGRTRDDLLECR